MNQVKLQQVKEDKCQMVQTKLYCKMKPSHTLYFTPSTCDREVFRMCLHIVYQLSITLGTASIIPFVGIQTHCNKVRV